MTLWTSQDISRILGTDCPQPWQASGVSIDSRSLARGDLFIALKGERTDGHAHVDQALERGAAAVLVSTPGNGHPLRIRVADTKNALETLARQARARFRGMVIGLTGSVGKTTAKEMLALIFGAVAPCHATSGNLNNHIGVPLTLARMPADARYAIIEMGMNHSGEIATLSPQARPHIALITTIAAAHMEFFDSLEHVADAKAEIFLGAEPGAIAVLNRDIPYFERLRHAAAQRGIKRILSFGRHVSADCRILDDRTFHVDGKEYGFSLDIRTEPMVMAAAAAFTCALAAGLDLTQSAKAFAAFRPAPGRGAVHHGRYTLIDETYNASPLAVGTALESLGRLQHPGRKIAVLGDMLELGRNGARYHQELAAAILAQPIDSVFTAGPLMQTLFDALPGDRQGGSASSAAMLLPLLLGRLKPGDCILIKGSHGMGMQQILDALRDSS